MLTYGQLRHEAAVLEFEYLEVYDPPGWNTWATCTVVEVVVYLGEHFLQTREGRERAAVTGSTLAKVLTQLRRAFEERCRSGA